MNGEKIKIWNPNQAEQIKYKRIINLMYPAGVHIVDTRAHSKGHLTYWILCLKYIWQEYVQHFSGNDDEQYAWRWRVVIPLYEPSLYVTWRNNNNIRNEWQ